MPKKTLSQELDTAKNKVIGRFELHTSDPLADVSGGRAMEDTLGKATILSSNLTDAYKGVFTKAGPESTREYLNERGPRWRNLFDEKYSAARASLREMDSENDN